MPCRQVPRYSRRREIDGMSTNHLEGYMKRIPVGAMRMLCACVVLLVAATGHAQKPPPNLPGGYPGKPIRIIVGNPPGGGVDTIARMVALQLTERWGHNFLVENQAGGTGLIAMNMVAKAPPDGYMMYLGGSQLVITTVLKKAPFDMRDTYAPVVQLTTQPYVLVANAAVPAASVKDLLALARSKPGALSYGSTGNGSLAHLGMELFKTMAGVDMLHIPYKGGGPAMVDLIAGRIQVFLATSVSVGPHLRSGKLKALAVTAQQRKSSLPDISTVTESGLPGYDLSNSYGLHLPVGTPAAILMALNRESNAIIRSPSFTAKLAVDDVDAAPPNTPAEFKEAIDRDFSKWERFFRTPGLPMEQFQ